MKRLSISLGKTCSDKSLLGISSQISIITPPPFLFRSNLNGSAKHFTKNCEVGSELSSLVSVMIRISTCFITSSFNCSNLFGSELIFIFPIITLLMFLNFNFKSRDASFMDSSGLPLKLFDQPNYQNYSHKKQNIFLSLATPAVLNHCP